MKHFLLTFFLSYSYQFIMIPFKSLLSNLENNLSPGELMDKLNIYRSKHRNTLSKIRILYKF